MSFTEIIAHLDASTARHVGTVRFFNVTKGLGFIKRDDGGADVFIHASELKRIDALERDQRVEFEIKEGTRGPIAGDLRILGGAWSWGECEHGARLSIHPVSLLKGRFPRLNRAELTALERDEQIGRWAGALLRSNCFNLSRPGPKGQDKALCL